MSSLLPVALDLIGEDGKAQPNAPFLTMPPGSTATLTLGSQLTKPFAQTADAAAPLLYT